MIKTPRQCTIRSNCFRQTVSPLTRPLLCSSTSSGEIPRCATRGAKRVGSRRLQRQRMSNKIMTLLWPWTSVAFWTTPQPSHRSPREYCTAERPQCGWHSRYCLLEFCWGDDRHLTGALTPSRFLREESFIWSTLAKLANSQKNTKKCRVDADCCVCLTWNMGPFSVVFEKKRKTIDYKRL